MRKGPFKKTWESSELLEIIHLDVCRSLRVKVLSRTGIIHPFIVINQDLDMCTHKFEAQEKFNKFKTNV